MKNLAIVNLTMFVSFCLFPWNSGANQAASVHVLVDTWSTSRSTDFQFSLTLYRVAIDTSDDHMFDVG